MEALGVSEVTAKVKDTEGRTALHLLCKYGTNRQDLMFLLDKYPGAISEKDNQGRIPLHLVAEGSVLVRSRDEERDAETVECLLEAYPDGVMSKDNDGKSPLELAFEKDVDLSLIYQLISVNPIVTMGLEGRGRQATWTRKRKRTTS